MNPDNLPFFVSGCSEGDMGLIAEIVGKQDRVFAHRWTATRGDSIDFSSEDHAGLIILGDDRYWATDDRYDQERQWLSKALQFGTPVLGICFGAQLLAAHLEKKCNGRAIPKNRSKEHLGVYDPDRCERRRQKRSCA